MYRVLTVAAFACLAVSAAQAQESAARAQEPKADCKTFIKGSDGRWMSTVNARIGNPKQFKLLRKGQPIERDMMIVGLNVSDTIDRLCGSR